MSKNLTGKVCSDALGPPCRQSVGKRFIAFALLAVVLLFTSAPPDASAQTVNYYWRDAANNGRWDWGSQQWYVDGGGSVGVPTSGGGAILYFQGNGTTTTYINSGFTSGWFKLNSIYLDSGSSGRNYSIQLDPLSSTNNGIELYNKIETLTGSGTLAVNCDVQLGANSEINAVGNSITLSALRMNGYTLNSYGANSLNVTGVISGTGAYNIKNQGITVTYSGSGANTFSGATTVESSSKLVLNKSANTAAIAGALTINSGALLRTDAAGQLNNQLVTVNGAFNMNGNNQSFALAGSGTVTNNAILTNNSTGDDTFSGIISSTGSLVKAGAGTLRLTGTSSTYTGATTILGGLLQINGDGSLGTAPGAATPGSIIISNATLGFGGSFALNANRGMTLVHTNATLNVYDGNTVTNNAIIAESGTAALTKSGGGTLFLGGNNTYTGATTVGNGVIRATHANAFGTTAGGVTVSSGAAVQLSGGIAIGAEALTLNSLGINESGGLRNISGDNSWAGALTVTNGRINSDSGTLTIGGAIGMAGAAGVTNALYIGGNGNVTLNGVITGASTVNNGALFFWGGTNSVLTLSANNLSTFSGLFRVRQGTVSITNANSLTAGVLELNSSGNQPVVLLVNSNTTRAYETKIDSTATATNTAINVATNVIFTHTGKITQSGSTNSVKFGKSGAGTLVFAASDSTYNGQIQIGEGTIILGNAKGLGTNDSTVARGIDLGLNVGDASTTNSVAALASNGVTVLQSIYIAPSISSATRSIGIAGNGTNSFTNEIYLGGTMTVNTGSAATDQVNISGSIIHTNGVIITNTGIAYLSASNSYTGGTTVGSGTLRIGNNNALGTGSLTLGNNVAFESDASARIVSNTVVFQNLLIGGTGALTFAGNMTNNAGAAATVTNNNAGGLTISNLALSHTTTGRTVTMAGTGNTTIQGVISNGASGASAGSLTLIGAGTTTLNGANTFSGTLTVGAGTLVIGNNSALGTGSAVFSNNVTVMSDSSARNVANNISFRGITVAGAGALTLSGTLTQDAGAYTITNNNNSLTLGNVALSSSGTGRTLTLAGSGNNTITGVISNGSTATSGNLTLTGSGTTTLSGANTFAGTTTISAGTLLLSGGADRLSTNSGVAITAAGTTLNLGGNGQTLTNLTTALTTSGTTTITNGSLTLGLSNVTLGNATNGSTIDMAGLTAFTFNGAARDLKLQTGTNGSATTNTFLLSARSNSITANTVTLGQSLGNSGTNISQVRLGTNNTFNAASLTVGSYGGQASLDFQTSISGGSLVLRGTNGSDAMTTWTIGAQNSGNTVAGSGPGAGFVDLTAGTLDANVTDVLIGNHFAGANATETSYLKIGAGTLTANTLTLGRKTNTGTVTFNSSVTQGGGLVDAGTLSLGDGGTNSSSVLKTVYNLNGGTLKVGTVNASTGLYANTSSNSLVINGGNLQNRSGVDAGLGGAANTADGRLYIVLSNNATNSITVDASRTMTISNTVSLVDAGGFSKLGTGTLILNSSNSYAGATTVSNGVLRIASSNALGTTAAGTTITSGSALELSGGITTAAEALTISGTGVSSGGALRNVSGDNTYAGAVTLGAATRFNSDTGTMTVSGAVGGSGQNLTIGGAGNSVVSGAIGTGAGTLTKADAGTLTLGASNTFTGATVISGGALVVSNGGALSGSTVDYNNQGGSLFFASNQTTSTFGGLSGAQNLGLTNATNGAVTLTVGNNNTDTTYSGTLSGGSLTKAGTATLTLTGAGVSSGTVSVYAGALSLNPGAGNTLNLGTRFIMAPNSGTATATFSSGTNNTATDSGISALGDGSGGTANFNVSGATVNVNLSTNRFLIGNKQAAVVTVSSGALNFTNNNNLYIGGDTQYTTTNAATGTLTINGTGAVTVSGSGSFVLGVSTNASGTLNLDGGTFTTSRNITLGNTGTGMTGTVNFNGGTLIAGTNSASFMTGLSAANIKSGGAKIDTAGFNITVGQNLSDGGGGGGLTKWGSGTLTLSGSNAYTGATTISNGGSLRIANADALGTTAAGTTVESGAELGISGTITTAAEALTLNGTGISSGGALRNIANANTYAGAITLGSASSIASDSGTLTLSGGMSGAGQNVTFTGSGNTTVSGIIGTGAGSLTKDGTGILTLSAGNTYTGATTINAGTLALGANDVIGDSSAVTVSGGYFDLGTAGETLASLNMSSGSIRRQGGTLTVQGASTITGGAVTNTATGSRIDFGGAVQLGGGSFLYASGSTPTSTTYNIALSNNVGYGASGAAQAVFTNTSGGIANFSLGAGQRTFAITNSGTLASGTPEVAVYWALRNGGLTKDGDGALLLAAANAHTNTTLTAGDLLIGNDAALGAGTVNLNGGTLAAADSNARTVTNALTIGGDVTLGQSSGGTGVLTFSNANLGGASRTLTTVTNVNFVGAVTNGSLTKAGNATLALSNTGTSLTQLNITAGTVAVQTNATVGGLAGSGSGALSIDGGTLTVNASTNSSFGQVISGAGGLTKTNTGTLTLSGNNSYSGATTIGGGTLSINGTNTSSAVTINSGGTLAGTGSAGATTVKSGGLLAPGNSIGTLSVDTLSIEGGSGYTWEVADVTGGVAGTDYDQIKVGSTGTGAVTFSATAGNPFTIYLTSYTGFTNWNPSGSYSWNIIDWGTVTTFDASAFAVNTNNFSGTVTGTFTFANTNGFLVMSYASGTPTYDTNSGTWSAGFVPSLANGNNAIFDGPGGNATNNIANSTLTSIGNLTFSNTAGAYTLSADSGSAGFDTASRLLVTGSIVNDSTNAQTINLALGFDAARTIDAAAGNMTFGGTISNGVGLTFTGISNNTVSGAISGAGTLTKAGNGTLVLSGANTYTGATTVSNGVVQLGNTAGLGATNGGTTVISGATLDLNGYNVTGEALSLAGTGVGGNGALINSSASAATNSGAVTLTGNTTIGSTGNMTLSGAVGGAYSLTKTGSGALTLSVSNAYSGGTVISSGAVFAGNNNAFGTGTITINGGGFGSTGGVKTFANNLVAGGDFYIAGGSGSIFSGTLDLGGTRAITFTNNATFNGVVSNGALTINAGGLGQDIIFSASNTYTGGTIINGGDVNLTNAGALFSGGAVNITATAGNAQLDIVGISASSTTIGSLAASNNANATFLLGSKTLIAGGNNNSTTFGGVMSGTGGFTKDGTGTMTFTRTNTYSGATTISNGEIALSGNGDLTSTTALNLAGAAARFDISGKSAAGETNGSLAGVAGSVVNLGSKNLNVGGDNTSTTFAGVISNTGSLTKSGSGTMTLSGANTFSGGSTLSAGVLRAANASALGTGALVASAGTTFEVTNGVNIANNLSVYTVKFLDNGNVLSGTITNNNSVYDVASGTTNTLSGFVTGTGGVELIGGGTLQITGATNNYSGNTTISNGTLQISTLANSNTVSSIGLNNNVTLAGANATNAVLDYTGGNVTTDRTFVMTNGGGTINMASSSTEMTLTGSASGSGKLIVGEGTLILNGASNAFAPSSIQVDSGATLQLAANNQIGDTTGLILNGGTFRVGTASTGFSDTLGTLTLSASSTIDLGAWATGVRQLTFANSSAITWTGTLTITNWQGVALQSSSVAEILFGTGGLSSTQLSQVYWANQSISGGTLISGGELVPIPEPRVYAAAVALLAAVGWRERKRLRELLAKGLGKKSV